LICFADGLFPKSLEINPRVDFRPRAGWRGIINFDTPRATGMAGRSAALEIAIT
jgi:hypothetical protein